MPKNLLKRKVSLKAYQSGTAKVQFSKLHHFASTSWICVWSLAIKKSHVMPLIALIEDRKASLQKRGVASIYLVGEDHDTDMKTFRDDPFAA